MKKGSGRKRSFKLHKVYDVARLRAELEVIKDDVEHKLSFLLSSPHHGKTVPNGDPHTDVTPREDHVPPKLAESLLIAFTTGRHADHMVGDLNERFARDCKKFGRRHAVNEYWKDTLRSLLPQLLRTIARILKWAIVAAVKWYF